MTRPPDIIVRELREDQKSLVAAKKRGKKERVTDLRARITELQKELEAAR